MKVMDQKTSQRPDLSQTFSEARKERARAWFAELQGLICASLEAVEDAAEGFPGCEDKPAGRFVKTPWTRKDHSGADGGGGVMALMSGRVFEKVGCHASTVYGTFAPEFAKQIPGADKDPRFWASGISLVAHMQSPRVPAVHMNTRFVVTTKAWFGGGSDLTPMTPVDGDTRDFHAALKAACDRHDPGHYDKFKKWCDEYFFLKHRNEPRGIGGIFFDDFAEQDFDASFSLARSVGDRFLDAYAPILERRKHAPFGERERAFQAYRRGRYVEFNLVYDRGTLFGLQSGGRTESILMSLPPQVTWRYDWKPQPGSPEDELYAEFLKPRDWI
jgi:coproporphyrinogen III oxidase